jgi:hypothetical protein
MRSGTLKDAFATRLPKNTKAKKDDTHRDAGYLCVYLAE